jgi:hypothetical protein
MTESLKKATETLKSEEFTSLLLKMKKCLLRTKRASLDYGTLRRTSLSFGCGCSDKVIGGAAAFLLVKCGVRISTAK